MKLVDVELTFDLSKMTFYFTADGRVDFRQLVRELAGVFRTRIELRQIGVRDEAKFKELAAKYGLSLMRLGVSGGEVFLINSVHKNLKALKEIYFGEFAKIVKSED